VAPISMALTCRVEEPSTASEAAVSNRSKRCYSITSSAVANNVGGTLRPSIRAVEALMTNSNFVDCTTGRSAGLAPFRMRPAGPGTKTFEL
jgi:hypothetical protein